MLRLIYKYIRIFGRLSKMGLLPRYLYYKLRYGTSYAKKWLLESGYEYGLHNLLKAYSYTDFLLVDVGAYPYEKIRYPKYYLGIDLEGEEIREETRVILKADINSDHALKNVEEFVKQFNCTIKMLTIDIEGNITLDTLMRLYPHFDIIVHEVHDEEEYEKVLQTAKKYNYEVELLDNLPYLVKHYIIYKKKM